MAPVEQEVVPFLQTLGLVVQAAPALHATQAPAPLQTWLVPQAVPAAALPPSTQVMAPVEQELVPILQLVGLPVHDCPAVQAMHMPVPLQTMLLPQATPAAFAVPFTHIDMPDEHDAAPL